MKSFVIAALLGELSAIQLYPRQNQGPMSATQITPRVFPQGESWSDELNAERKNAEKAMELEKNLEETQERIHK